MHISCPLSFGLFSTLYVHTQLLRVSSPVHLLLAIIISAAMESSERDNRPHGNRSSGASSSDGKGTPSSWDWRTAEELPTLLSRSTQVGHAVYEEASRLYLLKFAESWRQQPGGSSPTARRLIQEIYQAAIGGQDAPPGFAAPQPEHDASQVAGGAATGSEMSK